MKLDRKKLVVPFIFGIMCLFSILHASGSAHKEHEKKPSAKRGLLNIEKWDFNKQGSISLSGVWEVYIGHFIKPDHFEHHLNADGKEYLSSDMVSHNGETNGISTNIATLRMDIKTSGKERNFGLKIDTGNRPFQLWVGKELIADGFKGKLPSSAMFHRHKCPRRPSNTY